MYTAKIYTQVNGFVSNWNEYNTISFNAEPSKKDGVVGKAEIKKALKGHLKGTYVMVYWAAGQTAGQALYIFDNKQS
jgi:hypothetical protein